MDMLMITYTLFYISMNHEVLHVLCYLFYILEVMTLRLCRTTHERSFSGSL